MSCRHPFLSCRLVLGLLVASIAAAPGFAETETPPGTLVALQEVVAQAARQWDAQFEAKVRENLGAKAGALQNTGPQQVFKTALHTYLNHRIPSMGLTYTSVDASHNPRLYSARLFLPSRVTGSAPTRLPLVIYQHGTETRKTFTPYYLGGDETMLGALGAEAAGFAVAMPDGDGMGADPSPERHAYCHETTTARCLLDLARALEHSGDRIFDGINYVWDGRLFLMGYSEGGYIAMAAVKALTTDPACQDLHLDGAACMGGPFDLPAMIGGLLREGAAPYDRPYIPTYLLTTWDQLYGSTFRFTEAINPLLLGTTPSQPGGVDQGSITQWMDGVFGGDEITPRIQARLTGQSKTQIPARAVLNEAWAKDNLDAPDSPVNHLLAANGLVGDWVPKVPVLLCHDPYDECVPFANTQSIFDAWTRLGGHPLGIVSLAVGGRGPGHVGGAVLSIPTAFVWFKAGMPTSLMAMAAQTIREQSKSLKPQGTIDFVTRAAALATQEQNHNRAEFPLSTILYRAHDPAERWRVSLANGAVGKVKFYTLASFPQFPGQAPLPGHQVFTKFVGELKGGGSHELKPDDPCYMAVYPKNGRVQLALDFAGSKDGQPQSGRLEIRQYKNKLLGGSRPTFSGDLGGQVQPASYEHPDRPIPFLTFPRR